ncbi:MAG: hypothetical protein IH608_02010, partial [Proteobacteria bacterium]|nr:hypothetical protein [Pseudomonadota bacterium]
PTLLSITCGLFGAYFLVLPGLRLYRHPDHGRAAELFNRASYYPLAILCAVAVYLAFG